jgi:DNA invertase Pin-like site-specific DNA recombinase
MRNLPRSLEDLGGLRAARWIRESTERQTDRFGPDAQREQQDRAIDRFGLADTGRTWQIAHSGRTIATTSQFAEMMSAAGCDFDVLLVGYVSRFARDLRTAVNARHDLHLRGAALLFCDERVLSSDEDAWEAWAREAVEAEAYSRRLGRRVSEGYEAKFRRHRDPGGNAPLGFRRVNGLLEVDPDTVGRAVEVFVRYASGLVSLVELEAETDIDHEALKVMLRNPVYNGWVRRHRRQPDEQLQPAAWRHDPPVGDELWARVQEVRARRYKGGGYPTPRHVHLLAGRLYCVCGGRIGSTTDAAHGKLRRRYRHDGRCLHWGGASIRQAAVFDLPISAQVEQMRLEASFLAQLRQLAQTTAGRPDSTALRKRQLERELEELARRHARRQMATPAYLAEHARLSGLLDAADEPRAESAVVEPDMAVAWLSNVKHLWRSMDDAGRRDLAAALYDRITVTSDGVQKVKLTPEAERHGAVLAMPEVVLMARPEGLEPPTL